jgi:hypothetical protein
MSYMDSDRGLRMRKAVTNINWLKGFTADLGSLRKYACKAITLRMRFGSYWDSFAMF